jgi:hypothetical protein
MSATDWFDVAGETYRPLHPRLLLAFFNNQNIATARIEEIRSARVWPSCETPADRNLEMKIGSAPIKISENLESFD